MVINLPGLAYSTFLNTILMGVKWRKLNLNISGDCVFTTKITYFRHYPSSWGFLQKKKCRKLCLVTPSGTVHRFLLSWISSPDLYTCTVPVSEKSCLKIPWMMDTPKIIAIFIMLPEILNPERLSAFFCIDVDRTAENRLRL